MLIGESKFIKIIFCFILFTGVIIPVWPKDMQERLQGQKKIIYKVSFNGIPSGYIEWEYLGKGRIQGREVDILSVSSDTKILKLLNLTSKEQVFLDSKTYLPLRVERDIVLFGQKELIEEIYDQEKGCVNIKRSNSKVQEDTLRQDKPIHNILELLYFFPLGIELDSSKWMNFNLPNQKVRIKLVDQRDLDTDKGMVSTYFLVGRGAKRFSLWLDEESRLPLRLEFILPLGKIIILRTDSN